MEPQTASTTYGSSTRELLEKSFSDYRSRNLNALDSYVVIPELPDSLQELTSVIRTLKKFKSDLSCVKIGTFNCDIMSQIENHYRDLTQQEEQKRLDIEDSYRAKKERLTSKHADSVNKAKEHNASLDAELRELHKNLLHYKKPMKKVFARLGITPLDTTITPSTTESDFVAMLNCATQLCEKYAKRENGYIQKVIDYINDGFEAPYIMGITLLALLVCYLALPLLSVAFFMKLLLSTHNRNHDIEGLRMAASLMAEIDYARFIPEDRYIHVEDLDLSDIENDKNDKLSQLRDYTDDYMKDYDDAQLALNEIHAKEIIFQEEFAIKKNEILQNVECRLQEAIKKKDGILSKTVRFPSNQRVSNVMTYQYVLHTQDDAIDVSTDVGANNFVFDESDHDTAIATMKLYLTNMLLSVNPGNLFVEIIDSAGQCREFSEFFNDSTADIIKPCVDDFKARMNAYRKIVQDNIKEFKGKSIDEMNAELEKEERICKPYYLLIILDPIGKEFEQKDDKVNQFVSFLKYSTSKGVFIWMLDKKSRPNTVFVKQPTVQGDALPIKYEERIGIKMINNFIKVHTSSKKKVSILPYFGTYINKVCKEEDIWKDNTISGIEVNFGYADGDPSKVESMKFGDDNVHGLLVGGTGSGKSATINQIISSLIMRYPPSELILNFIDLKNAEAAKFAYRPPVNDKDVTIPEKITEDMYGLSRIPHMNILSGTSDGGYALSLISSLLDEMTRRQKICADYNVVKIEDLRKKYPEIVIPRILTIVDEFQQMFNKEVVSPKISDSINSKLGRYIKLARSFGGHLLFASQSMSGTLGSDAFSNFSLRCALRCDTNVSTSVLGNNASSLLPPKGYMYTNDSAGVKADRNKLWRVPFIDTDDMLRNIEKLNGLLDAANEKRRNCRLYDECTLYDFDDLRKVYKEYPDLLKDSNVFVLGEYTEYTDSLIPYTVAIKNDMSENISVSAFDKTDVMNLTSTLLENLRLKGVPVIMNVQDADLFTLMEVENYVDPELIDIARPTQDIEKFLDAIEDVVSARESQTDTRDFQPLFVCAMAWERSSVMENYRVEARLERLLKDGPSYNVHFILSCGIKGTMNKKIFKQCKHKIAGKQMDAEDTFYLEDTLTTKFPSREMADTAGNFAVHKFGTDDVKFKIYQRTYKNKVTARVVKIT